MARTGVTTETTKHFVIDAGAVFVNYGEPDERLLGATSGGNSFTVEQEIRVIEIDGVRGPLKGARRIVSVSPRLTVNLLEMTAENIALALAGSSITDETDHDSITREGSIVAADYVKNVALVGDISGTSDPIVIIVENALSDGEFSIEATDREEATVELQFTGHFDPADLDHEPWEIRFPKIV